MLVEENKKNKINAANDADEEHLQENSSPPILRYNNLLYLAIAEGKRPMTLLIVLDSVTDDVEEISHIVLFAV
ncbi:hypothetical protein CWI38_0994p0010 [Hamiltosporidium tvaerminnensis]|uniref:Uncharacterized protein n=1 Tax=Hamiltosporidium tvaerminnensis TaxID=1176355 RepID=A0A4Q9LTG8_9MICR|nr:hypothetical protein CWI38_0994p0010 [Hamiltosporidium tvaerminnensis]